MEVLFENWGIVFIVGLVTVLYVVKEMTIEDEFYRNRRSRLRKAFRRVRQKAKEKAKKGLTKAS